jgi:stalled ribosome alternative rescue factor ArfA
MEESEMKSGSIRNPIARALRSPHLRKQVIKPKKGPGSYDRRNKKDESE